MRNYCFDLTCTPVHLVSTIAHFTNDSATFSLNQSMEVEESLSLSPAFMARSSTFRIDVSSGSVSVLEDNAQTLMTSTEPGTKPLLPMDLDATLLYLEVISS